MPPGQRPACETVKAVRRQPRSFSRAELERARKNSPSPPPNVAADPVQLLGFLGTIGRATALALARVFAFATVVPRLAAALALARVVAFAGVLFFDLLVVLLVLVLALLLGAEASLQRRKQSRSLDWRTGAGEQSRERRTCEHGFCGFRH